MASWLDKILEGFGDDGLAFYFRKGTSFLNFAFSPLAPIIAAVLYRKKGFSRRDILFFLPEILNLTLCVVSLFTGLVFNVTPTNEYSRGLLFFLPFVINGFYAGMILAVQTYSVHDELMRDFEATFRRLNSLGFTAYELSHIPWNDKTMSCVSLLQSVTCQWCWRSGRAYGQSGLLRLSRRNQ